MNRKTFQYYLAIVVSLGCLMNTDRSLCEDPLIFISAFAPGDDGAVHAFRLNVQTGRLNTVSRTADMEHPFFLALSADGHSLYAIYAPGKFGGDTDEQVAAYKIVDGGKQLQLLNRQSTRGTASCYLDVDNTSQTLVVANYLTGSVASLPVQRDGSLGKPVSFIEHKGSSVNPRRQTGPHAHCIVISPDNRFAYAADLGLDQILGYRLNAANARLEPHQQPFVRTKPGAGPRHLTFHPSGRYVYVINELDNSVTLFDYDGRSGILIEQHTISTLPPDFDGTSHCADLKITSDGRFLFGTNRGHDSIAAYRIGDQGRLTLIGIEPSHGQGPQNLAISPGDRFLICANMPGNNVAVFRIEPGSGKLTLVDSPLTMPKPSCIMIR